MRTNSFVSCCGRCNLFALHDARGESRLLLAGYRRTRCFVRCVLEPEPSNWLRDATRCYATCDVEQTIIEPT